MSSPADSTAASFSDLPIDLHQFKLSAPQTIKGGGQQIVPLVKRPLFNAEVTEESKSILIAWEQWWCNTSWGRDPTADKPRWNSAARSGYIWNHFREASHALDGHPYVYCLNCGHVLQHPNIKSCGTKHLINHLKTRACSGTKSPVHEQPDSPFLPHPREQRRASTIPIYSPLVFEQELVRLVIDNNWSFRTIERPSFLRFLSFLRPNTVIMSRYKFEQSFEEQFRAAKAVMLQDLGSNTKISIALDAWTAANHLSFLAVKGYYINNKWELRERLLDFIPMRGRHTGVSMATEVLQVLKATNTTKKLLAITCDNASNNSTLSRSVETNLGEEAYTWNSRENTIPCLAHIINLVVQDIIYHLKLSAASDAEDINILQRQHIRDISTDMSVPNSLRKAGACLSQIFITY